MIDLRLLAQGLTNREIAQRLYLAEGTVKHHVTNLLGKLGVRGCTQAALRARELGLLQRRAVWPAATIGRVPTYSGWQARQPAAAPALLGTPSPPSVCPSPWKSRVATVTPATDRRLLA